MADGAGAGAAAIVYRARAELRWGWRHAVALALALTAVGGGVLGVATGIRRNATAYDRMVAQTHPGDVLVNPSQGAASKLDWANVRRLPQVRHLSVLAGLAAVPVNRSGGPDFVASDQTEILGATDHGLMHQTFRPKLLAGRLPDPRRPHEALANAVLASREHLHPGSVMTVLLYRSVHKRPQRISVRITGVGRFASEVIEADGYRPGRLMMTPSFYAAHRDAVAYWGGVATLRRGSADVGAFIAGVHRLVPREQVFFQQTDRNLSLVHRDTCPVNSTFIVFTVIFGLVGLLVIGQLLGRIQRHRRHEREVLRALGMGLNERFFVAMAVPAMGIAAGVVGALVVAVALSPLFPLGRAADAELHPGLAVNVSWLALGAGALLCVLLSIAALLTWTAVSRVEQERTAARPSRLVARLQGVGLPLAAVLGTKRALEGNRLTGHRNRNGLLGATASVAGVALALVFVTNLAALLHTSTRYGWNWDQLLETNAPLSSRTVAHAAARIQHDRTVDGVSILAPTTLAVDGRALPALGFAPRSGSVLPTMARGQVPSAPGELALGGRTIRSLHLHLGDHVTVASASGHHPMRMRLVGQAVLPTLGQYEGADNTDVGIGAVVGINTLETMEPATPAAIAMRFAPDASERARAAVLAPYRSKLASADWVLENGTQRPRDIVGLSRIGSLPLALAGVLAGLVLGTVSLALVGSLRARRRDLAVLKSLGSVRRQLAGVVAWEATVMALLSSAIGVVLGLAAGRWAWLLLTDELGVARITEVPILLLAATAALTVVGANLAALLPARAASRTPAAALLRSE